MLNTPSSMNGMVTAPHHLAAQAGLRVLQDGGNAVEAMVAAAAAVAVVYPHMNAVGGDGFWLISEPGETPVGIDAAGQSAALATRDYYAELGLDGIPARGPNAALNVAGTIGGWAKALENGRGSLPLSRLLEDAIGFAKQGIPVTQGQEELTREKLGELQDVPGFAETYLNAGRVLEAGEVLVQHALGDTLERLANTGLHDFYQGDIARANAAELEGVGSPLRLSDFEAYEAKIVEPLSVKISSGTLYNMTPPTQGISSLMILALFDRLKCEGGESFDHVHGLVEATKRAFILRNQELTDPLYMNVDVRDWLTDAFLDEEVSKIDPRAALPWPQETKAGDTIWMGAVDKNGQAVSFIQSIYWEYGSGVVVPKTGVLFQNRGHGFTLDADHPNSLEPGKRPFHTLNPAMAHLSDGSVMTYGNMGGEGQPQTQAAVYSRHVMFGQPLQQAVTAPRWLLGRTWGEDSTTLKLESRFGEDVAGALKAAGHAVDIVKPFTSIMGHAGAIVRKPDGVLLGATDPRSDGAVAAY